MAFFGMRSSAAILAAAALAFAPGVLATSAMAQGGGDQRPAEQQKQGQQSEPAKDASKSVSEFAEAARVLGGPAANPECVWLGRRVVNLMWRDDLDTAFRHLDLYDRFGCPGGHIQATFRCLVGQPGAYEWMKSSDTLNTLTKLVHACWINPSQQAASAVPPAGSGAAANSAPAAQPQSGTTTR